MEKNNSWVVINENDKRFFKYDAWVEIVRHSPVLRPLLFIFNSRFISWWGGKIYHWVSHHRNLMGKVSQFMDYTSQKKEVKTFRILSEGIGGVIVVTILIWNLTTIKKLNFQAPAFQNIIRWLHLYQEWNMFAPYPKMDNIWVEIPATLGDGTKIELLTGDRDPFSIKDQAFYEQIPNEHWRKFYLNLSERNDYARYYGGFLCRKWNDRKIRFVKDTTLRSMEIIVYSQPNLPGGDKGGISKKLSWRHWCFDEDYKKENTDKP